MNFFEHQDRARSATRRMLVLFVLAVAVVIAAVDAVVLIALRFDETGASVLDAPVVVAASLVTLAVIGAASMYKIATLRGGGSAVARGLGATPVPEQTTNVTWKRLRNVVEEIAIASGVPVPEIYVLEREAGINAFAAGYTPSDAAVAVTQGALDKLTRDELQGVIAHEFSHILNGDMRLNIRLMGVVFGILVLAIVGRKITENTRGSGSNAAGAVAFGVALLAIGSVGMLCGRLIKASVSRNREYLADASAVQFTRQTDGIAGALKKIGALGVGSRLGRADAEEVAHMLFGDGVGYSALMATHPPLVKRLKRIDPAFDERQFAAIAAAWTEPVHGLDADDPDASISGFVPKGSTGRRKRDGAVPPALPAARASLDVSAPAVVAQVGHPEPDDWRTAGAIRAALPTSLRDAAADPADVEALVFALALSRDAAVAERQLALVERGRDAVVRARVAALAAQVANAHPMHRLPLASLAFPLLRRKPRPQLQQFVVLLGGLNNVDGRIDIDEYCLAKLVSVQVIEALDPSRARPSGSLRLVQCRDAFVDVCAVVAERGHDDEAAARRAFSLALAEALPGEHAAYAPPADPVAALDRALSTLDRLQPAGKELVVSGLVRAISEDGRVNVAEAELLRTVCASLHCPLPPLATLA
jgi:Zn-dependent protease with chaperone function